LRNNKFIPVVGIFFLGVVKVLLMITFVVLALPLMPFVFIYALGANDTDPIDQFFGIPGFILDW
jgi:hypothetical protein